jgi:hypothetical protein
LTFEARVKNVIAYCFHLGVIAATDVPFAR